MKFILRIFNPMSKILSCPSVINVKHFNDVYGFFTLSLQNLVCIFYVQHILIQSSHISIVHCLQVDTVLESIELESYDHRELNLIWTDRYVFSLLKLRQGDQ